MNLHNNLVRIETGAFYNNKLTSITIPSSVTSIGNNSFRTNLLTNVIIEGDCNRFHPLFSTYTFDRKTVSIKQCHDQGGGN